MSLQARRDVFQAIADPTRRQIIEMLATRSMNLNSLVENFEISRPAISQQIKILEECGMVHVTQKGRERFCEVRLESLQEVQSWVAKYKKFWNEKLDNLEDFLDGEQLNN